MRPTITRPCWDWQCPYPARRGLRGYAWVHYRVFQVDPSVHIAISTAVMRRPRPSEFPTREFISQGVFGRSCFRATPAWSTRSRRGVNVRDALRAVYLTEATEPEHCRRVQTVVGKLPGLPGNRTWSFSPWRSSWAWASHREGGDGAPQRGRRPAGVEVRHGSGERWDEIPGPAGCGNQGGSFTNRGSWPRGAGLHHGTWGLIRWMIGCSTIAFTPAPMWQVLLLGSHASAGVIPGRSQRPWSGRCLSALGVMTIGAAAASNTKSALPNLRVRRCCSPNFRQNGLRGRFHHPFSPTGSASPVGSRPSGVGR